jgi:hypothetical protein
MHMYEALDPRSDEPAVERIALAARPLDLAGLRVGLIQSMPPGSGLEPIIEALQSEFAVRWPTAHVTHYVRKVFMMTDMAEIDDVAAQFDVTVVVSGPAATMVHLAAIFSAELERRGVPSPFLYFAPLAQSAAHSIHTVGAALRSYAIDNPPRTDAETLAAVAPVIAGLTVGVTPAEQQTGLRLAPPRKRVAFNGSLTEVQDFFYGNGWTDGLPIIPPTEALLAEMLTGTHRRANEVVTETFRPEARRITVEMVAINSIMAGARPEYLPVILATASVFGDLQFESMTRSVNSFAFAQLVSGPIAAEIGMEGGLNALGPGNRANATIGRALNLMFRTLGGAQLGVNATPTQGSALSYAFAFTENVAGSPWDPFHVDFGFSATDSTVSVLLGGWAHNGNFYYGGLDEVAATLQSFEIPQSGAFVFLSEKRAHQLADAGYSKQGVSDYLHNNARIRVGDFRASGFFPMMRNEIEGRGPSKAATYPREYLTLPDDEMVPAYPPGAIHTVVVGSDVSNTIQAWKLQLHRTVSVDEWR